MTDEQRPEGEETELNEIPATEMEDAIGDETDGEGSAAAEPEKDAETETEAEDEEDAEGEAEEEAELEEQEEAEGDESDEDDSEEQDGDESEAEGEEVDEEEGGAEEEEGEPEFKAKARPPVKLERLQKILAQSGVASRRKAEEMIEQGRVQVNGKIVTELGTKADAGRDHIRVDGKLLQGSERLRYFVLNKPRGFVTTVKDPEGRPTVMQFFDKMRERLYPVGRLDYMSEGLLLVTNDGDLANKLTKASAGVEKTYLVKVAGITTESELDILRAGVAIEKGKPGSNKVRTSPARIRQVRQGDNPWYEVVLIEGRNRELRKMFEEVGHFVEKIRRVGYGPLILDQEPGNLRELDEQELDLLRKAADGKWKTPKAKEIRRRNIVDSLPPEKPAFRSRSERPAPGPKDYKPKKSFESDRPARSGPAKFGTGAGRPGAGKFGPAKFGPAKFGPGSGAGRPERPAAGSAGRLGAEGAGEGRPPAGRSYGDRPTAGRTYGAKPGGSRPFSDKPGAGRSFPPKPAWKKPEAGERAPFKKPFSPRPEATRRPFAKPEPIDDLEPRKPIKIHIEPVADFERSERPRSTRPASDRPRSDRTSSDRPGTGRPPAGYSGAGRGGAGRTGSGRPAFSRPGADRPGSGRPGTGRTGGGSSAPRPFRSESGLGRPSSTSSGKPRAGGARPSSKPGGRSSGPGAGRSGPRSGSDSRPSFGAKRPFESRGADGPSGPPKRPYTPRTEGGEGSRPERRTGTGLKPKPNFGGKPGGGKPGGSGSRPKSGGPAKSGFKGKPGGKRPGGKRP